MSIPVPHDRIVLNKVKYSVRASQAVVQYSVGSMVDFPDQTLMPAAPELWDDSVERIHDERLEGLLHVKYFGMPGSKDLKQFYNGVSYVRFPEWYFCPKCRRLQPIKDWIKDYRRLAKKTAENDPYMIKHMNCPKCHVGLVVARIVTVCQDGHISDFPWVEWAHVRSKKPICPEPKMSLLTSPTAAEGLEGITVCCESCKARASLAGAFNEKALENLEREADGQYRCRCHGYHPWKNLREACDLYPKVMQRGSSSVYYPVVESSLVIPPFSSKDTVAIEKCEKYRDLLTGIEKVLSTLQGMGMLTPEMELKVKKDNIAQSANAIAASTLIPEDRVIQILERKLLSEESNDNENEETKETTASLKYRIEEFEALSSETPNVPKDGDFHKEIIDAAGYGLPFVKSISLIHKIREVEAMIGFTRIKPASREEGAKNEPTIVDIKESGTEWYPAYEIRGEGIFIEFDSKQIESWISENPAITERGKRIDDAYRASTESEIKRTAKYIMLHTLSHLLIKQLSFECGYGISSLKERIYCSEEAEGKEMAAIFIYTANGDSEGTLGGLVRQGREDCFPPLFKKALESAMICSNDPVCSLSKGQGRDSINLAACYSCALIPETSCERNNLCLDRGMLVGTFADHDIGMYSPYLYGEKPWPNRGVEKPVPEQKKDPEHEPKPVSEPVTEPKRVVTVLKLSDKGLDLKFSDYSVIWKQYLGFADSETEKQVYELLVKECNRFKGLEKPCQDAVFVVEKTGEELQCDLMWEKAKVLFFSETGEDDYALAKDSDWTCISVKEGTSVLERILNALKGEN